MKITFIILLERKKNLRGNLQRQLSLRLYAFVSFIFEYDCQKGSVISFFYLFTLYKDTGRYTIPNPVEIILIWIDLKDYKLLDSVS